LVPAIWWSDISGDWSTLSNWNSGQPLSTFNSADLNNPPAPYTPHWGTGQTTPFDTYALPVPRLPGMAGSGPAPTSGLQDTVILERPNANITVTLSSGTYNIRKLYMRETLNLVGGSLTVNYNPNYRANDSTTVLHGGPISAQFSGPVTISNSASFTVHTLQVDAAKVFTLAGGTVTLNTINLIPGVTPGKILMNGDVTFNPLLHVTAVITNGTGTGSSGLIDLGGGTRAFNVGNGSSDIDLSIGVPISNGGITKTGAGTMRLNAANTFTGNVTINGGTLRYGHSSGLPSSSVVAVNNGGILDMNGISDSVAALASTAGQTTGIVTQGSAGLTLVAASGTNTLSGRVFGSGTFIKNGASMQILNGNNNLGAVTVNTGSLLFNGTNATGAVTVNSGATLGGAGTISGAVTVNLGGTISPGASIGTLTLNNPPVFSGTNFMEIDRNGGSPLADKIILTSGTLNYGGTLVVSNVGAALTGGEVFTLFSATAYAGAFVSSNLPTLGSTLNWYLSKLVTNGTITVNRKPVVNGLTMTNPVPQALQIPIASLVGSATDADGDSLSLTGFDGVTTNGIVLTSDSTYLYYSNSANVADRFNYTISDPRGGSTIGAVQIASAPPPSITSGPNSLTVIIGQDAAFSVSASGTAPLSYQWRFNGANLSATLSNFTRTNSQCAYAGGYDVVVMNAAGSVTSSVAVLTVVAPTSIIDHPQSLTVTQGQSAVFIVSATNDCGNGLAYQWLFNDTNIAGATASSFARTNAQLTDAGSYSVIVSNLAGSATSVVATLTMFLPLPVVGFAADPVSGVAPLLVSFTNLTSGATNYSWDFGDGKTSTAEHPANTYTNAGNYTVSLTAIGEGGTNSLSFTNYITAVASAQFVGLPSWNGTSVLLHFAATPGLTNYLERSTNLPPTWVTIWTNVAPPGGTFDYTDNFNDLPGPPASAFYRLSWPP